MRTRKGRTERPPRAPRAGRPPRERIGRPDDADAFFPEPSGVLHAPPIPDTESFAQEFIDSATRAAPSSPDATDEVVSDEDGGPFIVLDAEGRIPVEPEPADGDAEPNEKEQEEMRGARWAARGT